MTIATIHDEAVRLAELGYRVFPCRPGEKKPLTSHGLRDATSDADQLLAWWTDNPRANLAVCTDDLFVLDIDPNGFAWLTLEREAELAGTGCPIASTPRGGRHYVFRQPEGADLRNTAGAIADGVDTRASGGYVCVAPSVVHDKSYSWLPGCELVGGPESLPAPPGWLLDSLAAKRKPAPAAAPVPHNGVGIPQRMRNSKLTSMAGTMRSRGMTEGAITAALLVENAQRCEPPLDETEVKQIAASVARYKPSAESSLLSDLGNAARFGSFACDKARWDSARGWRIWNGTAWELDETGRVERMGKDVVLSIFDEAKSASTEDQRTAIGRWAIKSQSAERIAAMLRLARESLAVHTSAFNVNPWLFNCRTGTIDLRTGELRRHDRADLLTITAPVEYVPDMATPAWDRFLNETFCEDETLIDYVQCWHGHCLTGDIREQVMPIYCGSGGNGKDTFLNAVCGVMGEFAVEAPPTLLMASAGAPEHPTEFADLFNRRLVIASEPEESARLKLSLVKRLTGNMKIKARYMRQDFFEFPRTHKLILVTNHKPVVRENSEATWRRLKLVPFSFTVPEAQRDVTLGEKLRAEWPGILGWLVRGCLRWLNDGLPSPAAVMTATAQYRSESDSVGEFLDETESLRPGCWLESKELHRQFVSWCEERGEHAFGGRPFTERLRAHGCKPVKQSGTRGWIREVVEELPI